MVDSMDTYESLNINNETVIENLEMLNFVSDHLKTKDMCDYVVKNYLSK